MDVTNSFLTLVALPFTALTFFLLLPPFYFFKFFVSIFWSIFSENVAGKVVIVTGASSGIGEVIADQTHYKNYLDLATFGFLPKFFFVLHSCSTWPMSTLREGLA